MNRYLNVAKGWYLTLAVYRFGLLFTLVSNIIYVIVIYFLWQSVYGNATEINGMTFNQVFVYLTLAASIFILFNTYTDGILSSKILEGTVVVDLIKPLDFQLLTLSESMGFMAFNGIIVTIPSIIVLFVVFQASIPLGINLIFLPICVAGAYSLSFMIDYTIGLLAFYTESLWGISITKEVIVTALSGALIPLQFFPESIRNILEVLPFQAIYHTPLQIITNPDLEWGDYLNLVGVQLLWVVVFALGSRLFYRQAVKVLTINGG